MASTASSRERPSSARPSSAEKTNETRLNAAYLGKFYLPGTTVEAMYDATQHARQKGQWVEVVPAR